MGFFFLQQNKLSESISPYSINLQCYPPQKNTPKSILLLAAACLRNSNQSARHDLSFLEPYSLSLIKLCVLTCPTFDPFKILPRCLFLPPTQHTLSLEQSHMPKKNPKTPPPHTPPLISRRFPLKKSLMKPAMNLERQFHTVI